MRAYQRIVEQIESALLSGDLSPRSDPGQHIADASDSAELMQVWLRAHTKLFEAIRDGDADVAAHRIRKDLFDHYQLQAAPERREVLERMLRSGS